MQAIVSFRALSSQGFCVDPLSIIANKNSEFLSFVVNLYLYVPGFGVLEAIAEGLDGNAVNLAGKSRIQLTGNAYKLDLEYGRAMVSAIGCETLSKGPYSHSQVVDFDLG